MTAALRRFIAAPLTFAAFCELCVCAAFLGLSIFVRGEA